MRGEDRTGFYAGVDVIMALNVAQSTKHTGTVHHRGHDMTVGNFAPQRSFTGTSLRVSNCRTS